jgi:hypothetical protein
MRLRFWQKTAVFATTAVVGVTGLLWFVLHDLIDAEPGEATHDLLMLHGVSSYAILVVIGSLLPRHVRSGWVRRRNLVTGITVTVVMTVLAVTGLGLYYGGEELHTPVRWLHVAFGLGCFVLFPAHAFLTAGSQRPSESATTGQGTTTPPELAAGPG